jgi:hypothetical protein
MKYNLGLILSVLAFLYVLPAVNEPGVRLPTQQRTAVIFCIIGWRGIATLAKGESGNW